MVVRVSSKMFKNVSSTEEFSLAVEQILIDGRTSLDHRRLKTTSAGMRDTYEKTTECIDALTYDIMHMEYLGDDIRDVIISQCQNYISKLRLSIDFLKCELYQKQYTLTSLLILQEKIEMIEIASQKDEK